MTVPKVGQPDLSISSQDRRRHLVICIQLIGQSFKDLLRLIPIISFALGSIFVGTTGRLKWNCFS